MSTGRLDRREFIIAAGATGLVAGAEGTSISAWLTAAARRALLVRDGLAAVAEWETEHGALTAAELEGARSRIQRTAARPKRARR